jgi:glucose/arabinose dehydrogenase
LLITTQPGALRVIEDGRLLTRPALEITSRVCRERERGLVGVAVDPLFRVNRFVYVYYTFKKFGSCPSRSQRAPVNRTVRYRMRQNGTLEARSARILIDNVPSYHGTHNGGDLGFGKDGYLYVSIGDGGRDYARRTAKSFTNAAARDRNVLLGKIVRITRAGRPAPGNPLSGRTTVRCSTTGPVKPGLACREIYARGLRNPFRFAFDPNAAATRFFVNDVGEVTWEEVNVGQRAADYGWNLREGPCPVHGRVRCGPTPPRMTDPVLAYGRREGCGSITGGAFVPNGVWPRQYDGAYLFADFLCGKIFLMDAAGGSKEMRTFAALPVPGVTSMTFGPSPSGVALYYVTFAHGGEVRRVVYRP